jgi:hypothetical protein
MLTPIVTCKVIGTCHPAKVAQQPAQKGQSVGTY